MSELALIHLRQARSFAKSGNPAKAVELLEKARVLARDNIDLKSQVLQQLAEGYDAVGKFDRATLCREQLHSLNPMAASARALPIPEMYPVRNPRSQTQLYIFGSVAAALLIAGLAVGIFLWQRPSPNLYAGGGHGGSTLPSSDYPLKLPPTTAPTAKPVKPPRESHASLPTHSSSHDTGKLDRQQMLQDTVGLCVVVLRYEGPFAGTAAAHINIPVVSGTAFAISSSGIMLTNRHVLEAVKEINIPTTLEQAHLPTMTYRGVSYIICFGPSSKDRYTAKVLHKSEQFDMAILKVEHRFIKPLTVASRGLRQGDDILVCGYPGAVMAALNQSSNTPAHIIDISQKWQNNHNIDAFDGFSPDSFNSTLTKGIVSAPERNIKSVAYMQIDATISSGNSGGPVLNLDNEVVGIATWTLNPQMSSGATGNYNFALLMPQLQPDIEPYAPHE